MWFHFPYFTQFSFTLSGLLRQSNPNWEAYFFVTDDQPFDAELQEILKTFGDIRLKFLDVGKKFRPAVSTQYCFVIFGTA